jgi:hypothetical protein
VPGKYRNDDYWKTTGAYTKPQLEKIASTIVSNMEEYDDYTIDYSYSHGKMRAQLSLLKGPHLEFRCHHVIIKKTIK